MLFNPKWEVKADPFSLENLIAWLEKQPAAKEYCFMDLGGCMYHQYFIAMGLDVRRTAGTFLTLADGTTIRFPGFEFSRLAAEKPHTFGAALERARSVQQ